MTHAQSFALQARQFTLGARFHPGMAPRFLRVAGPDEKALSWMVENRGQIPVEDLADSASLSSRQFRRTCFDRTGLTPKRLARVLRFRQALRRADQARPADWAQVALDCGYYDQAHLINEFREFSGFAPGEFAAYSLSQNLAEPAASIAG